MEECLTMMIDNKTHQTISTLAHYFPQPKNINIQYKLAEKLVEICVLVCKWHKQTYEKIALLMGLLSRF
jgi:hypothetical protein